MHFSGLTDRFMMRTLSYSAFVTGENEYLKVIKMIIICRPYTFKGKNLLLQEKFFLLIIDLFWKASLTRETYRESQEFFPFVNMAEIKGVYSYTFKYRIFTAIRWNFVLPK